MQDGPSVALLKFMERTNYEAGFWGFHIPRSALKIFELGFFCVNLLLAASLTSATSYFYLFSTPLSLRDLSSLNKKNHSKCLG